jgi:outer membrane protein
MEAGYQVGTRTIVDVLDATSTLFSAKQQLSDARYSYMINELNIKSALGTLNEQDLQSLNARLGKDVSTSPEAVAPETPEQNNAADNGNAAPARVHATPVAQSTAPARASGNPFSK